MEDKFAKFSGKELDIIQSAFYRAIDNMEVDASQQILKNLAEEISAERIYRGEKKKKIDWAETMQILRTRPYNKVRPCDDDEKLVVLCMINKQLKEMQNTLTLLSNALISNSEKEN